MNSRFNAIDYSQQLQAVGVSRAQAEMHAKLLSEALSNCELKTELTARMDIFETRIVARMEEFEANVKLELAKMRVEIADMRREMHSELASMRSEIKYNRRMINLVLALQVALIVKMFFP